MASMRRFLLSFCWAPVLAALVNVSDVRAQSQQASDQEVGAAFLYQFGRYVEWPPERAPAGEAFSICLLGGDPFGSVIDATVRHKAIGGVPVLVKRIVGTSEAADCRVVFLGDTEGDDLPTTLRGLSGTGALTVGEGYGFTRRGGMIAFVHENRKLRFAVNLAAVEAARLRLSSQLLRLAISLNEHR